MSLEAIPLENYNEVYALAIINTVFGGSIGSKLFQKIREELEDHNICHAILETEAEICDDKECHVHLKNIGHHHHHH